MKTKSWRAALPLSALIVLTIGCAPAATSGGSKDQSLVTAEDLQKHPGEPIENIIQRKVPGIVVTRSDNGNLLLQIRDATTVMGYTKTPLYVLNGLVFNPGPDGALAGIDPFDIATIKVLKGPEAAIYGHDGAHGVIVITTKKAGPRR